MKNIYLRFKIFVTVLNYRKAVTNNIYDDIKIFRVLNNASSCDVFGLKVLPSSSI